MFHLLLAKIQFCHLCRKKNDDLKGLWKQFSVTLRSITASHLQSVSYSHSVTPCCSATENNGIVSITDE